MAKGANDLGPAILEPVREVTFVEKATPGMGCDWKNRRGSPVPLSASQGSSFNLGSKPPVFIVGSPRGGVWRRMCANGL